MKFALYRAPSQTLLTLSEVYPLWFLSSSSSSEVFCDSKRNILKENDIVRFRRLADTYQRIADEGPDVFYNGSMARSIVQDIKDAGAQLLNLQNKITYKKQRLKIPSKYRLLASRGHHQSGRPAQVPAGAQ